MAKLAQNVQTAKEQVTMETVKADLEIALRQKQDLEQRLADAHKELRDAQNHVLAMERRMKYLDKAKSMVVTHSPTDGWKLELDGPWTVGDYRKMHVPFARAMREHNNAVAQEMREKRNLPKQTAQGNMAESERQDARRKKAQDEKADKSK